MAAQSPKIAFLHVQDPIDPHTWSGIPRSIVLNLIRAGARVEVIAPLARTARCLLLPKWFFYKLSGKTYHVNKEPLLASSYARQIQRRMRGQRFDLILATETFLVSALDRPEPIAYWSDGLWDLMSGYYYPNPTKSLQETARRHDRIALQRADLPIYSSHWAAAAARKYGARRPIPVIPFGANLSIRHQRADVEKAIGARLRGECVLLFIGVDWKRKGGDVAVNTARILNENGVKTRLIVVGCRPPGKLPKFVEVIGYISKRTTNGEKHLAHLLRTADFLILPTRAECAGVVFSEASAFGLPIITSDTGGVPTYVPGGRNGVRLPPLTTAEGYAHEIIRLKQDRCRYENMALAGWREYESRLNWSTSIDSLLSLVKHLTPMASSNAS